MHAVGGPEVWWGFVGSKLDERSRFWSSVEFEHGTREWLD